MIASNSKVNGREPMLPKTRGMLIEFYREHNAALAPRSEHGVVVKCTYFRVLGRGVCFGVKCV